MDHTNPTLSADEVSEAIIQNGFRPELEDYAADSATPLEDPLADERGESWPNDPGSKPAFVLTSYPETTPLYPHLIIEESSDDAGPIDQRQSSFYQHDYAIRITAEARNSTEKFRLKSGVKAFLQDREQALKNRGFGDYDYSGTSADWDPTSATKSWQATVSGLVHTVPTSENES